MGLYLVLFVLILTFVLWNYGLHRKHRSLPRGPATFPVLGNIIGLLTAEYPHLKFFQWAEQFGSLYTIYLVNRPVLVLSDAKLMKQLLSHQAATGKFKTDSFLLITRGSYGILMMEGPSHAEQRQFAIKSLKQFALGSRAFEELLTSEILDTCRQFSEESKIFPYETMKQVVANTLWTLVTGHRLTGEESPRLAHIFERFIQSLQRASVTGLFFLPWLKHISKEWSGYAEMDKACVDLHDFIEDAYQKERQSWTPESSPRHLIDCYLDHLEKTKENKESVFYGDAGYKNSIAALIEVFAGGVETTASTITWLMFYLIWNPAVKEKLYQEIDDVVGKEEVPSLDHRRRMPYLDSVILETQRYSSVMPLGLAHELLEDISDFCGYSLPKGLILVPNMYRIHHNPETWKDPETFRPERFLEDPKLKDHIVAFQPGKRSCAGEPLAKDMMFLMVTTWLQNIRIEKDPEITKEMYFEGNIGLGIVPANLPIRIFPR